MIPIYESPLLQNAGKYKIYIHPVVRSEFLRNWISSAPVGIHVVFVRHFEEGFLFFHYEKLMSDRFRLLKCEDVVGHTVSQRHYDDRISAEQLQRHILDTEYPEFFFFNPREPRKYVTISRDKEFMRYVVHTLGMRPVGYLHSRTLRMRGRRPEEVVGNVFRLIYPPGQDSLCQTKHFQAIPTLSV